MSSKLANSVSEIVAKVQDLYNEYCLPESDNDSKKSLNTYDLDDLSITSDILDSSSCGYYDSSDGSYDSSVDCFTGLLAGLADYLFSYIDSVPNAVFVDANYSGDISVISDPNYKRGKYTRNEFITSQSCTERSCSSFESVDLEDVFDELESNKSLNTGGASSSNQGFTTRSRSQIKNGPSSCRIDMTGKVTGIDRLNAKKPYLPNNDIDNETFSSTSVCYSDESNGSTMKPNKLGDWVKFAENEFASRGRG